MSCWLLVSSPENFERTRRLAFTVQGMKTRHRRKAERMQPGELLLFYVTRQGVFAGACAVKGRMFEDREPLWFTDGKPDETYPWRVRMTPLAIPEADACVPAEHLKDQLRFVKKWPAPHWRLAFQGHVHELPEEDGTLILNALRSGTPHSSRI